MFHFQIRCCNTLHFSFSFRSITHQFNIDIDSNSAGDTCESFFSTSSTSSSNPPDQNQNLFVFIGLVSKTINNSEFFSYLENLMKHAIKKQLLLRFALFFPSSISEDHSGFEKLSKIQKVLVNIGPPTGRFPTG